jgi:hypothetical protein
LHTKNQYVLSVNVGAVLWRHRNEYGQIVFEVQTGTLILPSKCLLVILSVSDGCFLVELENCIFYCTVLYCTVLYCTLLYCTVLYCTVLYCAVPCGLVWCENSLRTKVNEISKNPPLTVRQ